MHKNFFFIVLFVSASVCAMSVTEWPPVVPPEADSEHLGPNYHETRRDVQEEVAPCFDLSGELLPGCDARTLREELKRPRRTQGPEDLRVFKESNISHAN